MEILNSVGFTDISIMSLPEGTKVKIKDSTEKCHESFKIGGSLVFIDSTEEVESDEYYYGISVESGACYKFHASCYELV